VSPLSNAQGVHFASAGYASAPLATCKSGISALAQDNLQKCFPTKVIVIVVHFGEPVEDEGVQRISNSFFK